MTDYRLLMTGVVVLSTLGMLGAIWPVLDRIVPAVLAALGATGWVVGAIRRELRIRRRLADPRVQPVKQESRT
jgi:hypothetical protein